MKRIITITSGKGGVGKTNIAVNLAAQIAGWGVRTCVFDADLGLANINILLGVSPEHNLEDVISGEKKLADIVIHDPCGFDIIPGGTGVEKLTAMMPDELGSLINSFSGLKGYDVLIFDTSAGISREVISFCMASKEILLVVIPEPTSLTDGYSLLKVLSLNGYCDEVKVIINQAKNERVAQVVFNKFKDTVQKYLPLKISCIGCLPADETVAEAVARQRPFIKLYPSARAAQSITRLARKLFDHSKAYDSDKVFEAFWKRYTEFAKCTLNIPNKKTKVTTKPPEPEISSVEKKQAAPLPTSTTSVQDIALSQKILDSLNQLVTVATDVSFELKEIRGILEEKKNSDVVTAIHEDSNETSNLSSVISLDFEAYAERKKANL